LWEDPGEREFGNLRTGCLSGGLKSTTNQDEDKGIKRKFNSFF